MATVPPMTVRVHADLHLTADYDVTVHLPGDVAPDDVLDAFDHYDPAMLVGDDHHYLRVSVTARSASGALLIVLAQLAASRAANDVLGVEVEPHE